ncbi:unnamed protein product [Protopolystoma xenopodis]|uniref:Uncharacterized protein n=1 Tax=Protopolystoma xenopodis TaxID=117903 RepID=A0A3S5FEV7_9PLAT|nr:unnamed protein product [Protopolystoma xenopodis]
MPSKKSGGLPPMAFCLIYQPYGSSARGPVEFPLDTSTRLHFLFFDLPDTAKKAVALPIWPRPKCQLVSDSCLGLIGLVGETGYQLRLSLRNIVGIGEPATINIQTGRRTRPGPVRVGYSPQLIMYKI